jgi:iron complex outermembrane receptor protein
MFPARMAGAAVVALAPWIPAPGVAQPAPALDEVVVTATRHETSALELPASVSVVDAEAVELRAPARGGDLLRDVPNVYVRGVTLGGVFPGSAQAALSMRGVPRGMRTLVLVDGLPLNNALSGAIDVASIPVSEIERVEVVRGPMSALYGGHAMGGVINYITVIPDAPVSELRIGIGNMGQHRYGLLLRRRFDPQGWGVSFSWNRRDSDGYPDSDWVVVNASPGAGTPGVTGAVPTRGRDGSPAWLLGYKGERPWHTSQASLAADRPVVDGGRIRVGATLSSYQVGYGRPVSFMRDAAGEPLLPRPRASATCASGASGRSRSAARASSGRASATCGTTSTT